MNKIQRFTKCKKNLILFLEPNTFLKCHNLEGMLTKQCEGCKTLKGDKAALGCPNESYNLLPWDRYKCTRLPVRYITTSEHLP